MSDLSHAEIVEIVACALSISEDELDQRETASVLTEIQEALAKRQTEFDAAQGRINKRLAQTRLTQAQRASEAAELWQKKKSLQDILDEAMKLADTGSFFRATDLLQREEPTFKNSGDTELYQRFSQVQKMIQNTLTPRQISENDTPHPTLIERENQPTPPPTPPAPPVSSATATPPAPPTPPPHEKSGESMWSQPTPPQEPVPETPKETFDEKPEPPPPPTPHKPDPIPEPPAKTPEPEFEPIDFDLDTASTTLGPPPKSDRFTLSLGAKGRLHVNHSSKPLTLGRWKSQHGPGYELIAAVKMDKSESSRLIRMLSSRHGSLLFGQNQWGIADHWPGDKSHSTNGIYIEGARVERPASFEGFHGRILSFASPDTEMALPHFRIHILEHPQASGHAVFLERLDEFKDHILLISDIAQLPPEFDSLVIRRIGEGFVFGPDNKQVSSASREVLTTDHFDVTPFENVFYGREI